MGKHQANDLIIAKRGTTLYKAKIEDSLSDAIPVSVSYSGEAGTSALAARADHSHPRHPAAITLHIASGGNAAPADPLGGDPFDGFYNAADWYQKHGHSAGVKFVFDDNGSFREPKTIDLTGSLDPVTVEGNGATITADSAVLTGPLVQAENAFIKNLTLTLTGTSSTIAGGSLPLWALSLTGFCRVSGLTVNGGMELKTDCMIRVNGTGKQLTVKTRTVDRNAISLMQNATLGFSNASTISIDHTGRNEAIFCPAASIVATASANEIDFVNKSDILADHARQIKMSQGQFTGNAVRFKGALIPPSGATTQRPQANAGNGAVGTSFEFARADHVHPASTVAVPDPSTDIPLGPSPQGEVGSSTDYARADHSHPLHPAEITLHVASSGSANPADPLGGDAFRHLADATAWYNLHGHGADCVFVFDTHGRFVETKPIVLADAHFKILGGGATIECNSDGINASFIEAQDVIFRDLHINLTGTKNAHTKFGGPLPLWAIEIRGICRFKGCTVNGGIELKTGSMIRVDGSGKQLTIHSRSVDRNAISMLQNATFGFGNASTIDVRHDGRDDAIYCPAASIVATAAANKINFSNKATINADHARQIRMGASQFTGTPVTFKGTQLPPSGLSNALPHRATRNGSAGTSRECSRADHAHKFQAPVFSNLAQAGNATLGNITIINNKLAVAVGGRWKEVTLGSNIT